MIIKIQCTKYPEHPVIPYILFRQFNSMDKNAKINQLTHRIIACAMEVHNQLGNGFQEVIYQQALALEFGIQGLGFEREKEMELTYKGENIGTRRVDFLVEGAVMVEIKALEKLEPVHKAQAINYCEAYEIADGLLINFGGLRLEFNRVYNKKLKDNA